MYTVLRLSHTHVCCYFYYYYYFFFFTIVSKMKLIDLKDYS